MVIVFAILTIVGFMVTVVVIRKVLNLWMSPGETRSDTALGTVTMMDSGSLTAEERAMIRKRAAEKLKKDIAEVNPLGQRTFGRHRPGELRTQDSENPITGSPARADTKEDDHHG